jgi:hypothetical protein
MVEKSALEERSLYGHRLSIRFILELDSFAGAGLVALHAFVT